MMRSLSFRTTSLAALCATLLLAGCGGAPEDMGAQETVTTSPQVDTVTAQQYPDCDPTYYCRVWSMYVPCSDGIIMFAFSTPDGGYCIERNVCAGHGSPTICPYD
ncbi:hypothetical protein [Pyxidicoccus xibeiensis]|uniref:hypothetical protein n=1 Tax=Pyxidicoccus xibeiensis TaxID=2906759 RepID=UPI0020A7D34D|nr:hypothetical protein [Pyxidicoccus xibeiensis]MCP3137390.1 hypothetical protein [Pyxidicoccus xibeiensis]